MGDLESTTAGRSRPPDSLSSAVYTLGQPASPQVLTPGTRHPTHTSHPTQTHTAHTTPQIDTSHHAHNTHTHLKSHIHATSQEHIPLTPCTSQIKPHTPSCISCNHTHTPHDTPQPHIPSIIPQTHMSHHEHRHTSYHTINTQCLTRPPPNTHLK